MGPAAAADPVAERHFADITDSYQLHVGMESAGPVLFKDTPDQMLDTTTAFEYGGHATFLLGDERWDEHRLGLSIGYDAAAKSATRKLDFITPAAVYETGHPLVLQLAAGWGIASGTTGFASNYSGLYTGATLRYSFLDKSSTSPVSVSFGLTGRVIASTTDLQYSSAFIGGQLELIFHLGGKKGASK